MRVIGARGIVYAQDEIDDDIEVRTTAGYEEPLEEPDQITVIKILRKFMKVIK